uniref:RING-type domain-containing protein n=1 Tax=Hordeum vulgare subsp. vulgare TaxID=112509 RepID=A0A8I6XPC0_HORVV
MLSEIIVAAEVLLRALIGAVSVAAGTLIGAVGGFLSGIIDENGMMKGTLMGAITGGIVSAELAESTITIWCCNDYSLEVRIRRTLELQSLLLLHRSFMCGGAFVTVSSALESEMDVLLEDELFEPRSPVMATPRAIFDSLLVREIITKETAEQQNTCTICLYEFQAGDSATMLPNCCHMFHLACIDNWLMCKSVCPMCRRPLYTGEKNLK